MEPYALIPGAGPFAASACELEDLLAERGREVQRQLLQDHLDLRAAREEQAARAHRPPAAGANGITRSRLETGHGRLLASLFGTVRVTRCAWRRPGAPNLYLADAALSLPPCRRSHALARLAAVEAARGSFETAHAAVTGRCGPVTGKRQAEQAVVSAASDIAAFYAARVPVPCTAPTLLVISADAKGIVMRPGALAPGHRESRCPPRQDAHPADRRGEAQPQADGHPGVRLRHRPGSAPPARRHRPARRAPRQPRHPALMPLSENPQVCLLEFPTWLTLTVSD
jgi:hypothetical protein